MADDNAQFYWEIIERDDTVTKIPPDSVQVVQKRLGNGDPIHTRTRSIPASQVRSFRITGERYSVQPLLEAASQAFNEPILTENTGVNGTREMVVKTRWVKIIVPMDKWYKYYSASPGYKMLGELNGMAELAISKPIHLIDVNKTPYCTDVEITKLTGY